MQECATVKPCDNLCGQECAYVVFVIMPKEGYVCMACTTLKSCVAMASGPYPV